VDHPPLVVGSASGRAWIGCGLAGGYGRLALFSFRSAGAALASSVETRSLLVDGGAPMNLIIGSQFVYHESSGSPGGAVGELQTAPLLANGGVGEPRAVPDNPEKILPEELHPRVVTGVQVGARTVWMLAGGKSGEGGNEVKSYAWACCTGSGEAVDLSRYVFEGKAVGRAWSMQLGFAGGRLWLTWIPGFRSAVAGYARMVELDPATLAPRTAKPLAVPGGPANGGSGSQLVCGAVCSVVKDGCCGGPFGIFTWAPGDRTATRLASGRSYATGDRNARDLDAPVLLAASYRSGRPTAAYVVKTRVDDPKVGQVEQIRVVRGDGRVVGSVDIPDAMNPSVNPKHLVYFLYRSAYATFFPGGLAVFATYYGEANGRAANRVISAFAPLAR
jgi:hypothetical protein